MDDEDNDDGVGFVEIVAILAILRGAAHYFLGV